MCATRETRRKYLENAINKMLKHFLRPDGSFHRPFVTEEFLLDLHKSLYGYNKYNAGRFRKFQYDTIRISGAKFTPAEPLMISAKMNDLCRLINNDKAQKALITPDFKKIMDEEEAEKQVLKSLFIASFIHHKITTIHPFSGGNGRLARLIMSMMLISNHVIHPLLPISLDSVIKKNKKEYIDVLAIADKDYLLPFVNFLARSIRDAYEDLSKRTKE